MKPLEILLGCMLIASPLKAQTNPPLIQDGDMKHVIYSGAAFVLAEQTLYRLINDSKESEKYAFLFAAGLGIGKEFGYDWALGKGNINVRDFVANGLGLLAGLGVNRLLNKFTRKKLPLQISFSYSK